MLLFSAYRISERGVRDHYRRTRLAGLVPLGFALTLAHFAPAGPGPGVLCALGASVGLHLVLWGSYTLHHAEEPKTAWGRKLVLHTDAWFPPLLFLTRHSFYGLILLMLWFSLIDLGFPSSLLLHLMVFAVLLLVPLKALAREAAQVSSMRRYDLLDEFTRYAIISLVVFFIATSVTHFVLPAGQPLTGEAPPHLVVVWVPAILIVLCCQILFLDHALHQRKERGARRREEATTEF